MTTPAPILTVKTMAERTEIVIKKYEDGAVSLASEGVENFIYLYPAQVEVLRAFLGATFHDKS